MARKTAPAPMTPLTREAVLSILDDCEGHGVYEPAWALRHGLPQDFVDSVTHTLRSDGTPKGTIFKDGGVVPEVKAIHDLTLVTALCRRLGVNAENQYFGRGSECRELVRRIRAHYEALDVAALRAGGNTPGEEHP